MLKKGTKKKFEETFEKLKKDVRCDYGIGKNEQEVRNKEKLIENKEQGKVNRKSGIEKNEQEIRNSEKETEKM